MTKCYKFFLKMYIPPVFPILFQNNELISDSVFNDSEKKTKNKKTPHLLGSNCTISYLEIFNFVD